VAYPYATTADQIVGEGLKPPTGVDLTLIAEIRDNTNTVVKYLQVNIPKFQISGNYTLSLTAAGVSNQSLDGTALLAQTGDVATADYFYKATFITASGTAVGVSSIAIVPSVLSFSVASGLPQSKQFNLLGIRGGLYSNLNITASGSYTRTSGCTTISTGSFTGLTTISAAAHAGDTALFAVSYFDPTAGSLVDSGSVVVTA
jgi:hypothetical protein